MHRRGFTIVELLITIAVAGILLVLGVVNLRSTQVNARDEQRKTDINNIALNLEDYYSSGISGNGSIGRYPTTSLIGSETTYLANLDPQSLVAPGANSSSLVAATNDVQTPTGILPQPTSTTYVYQPLYFNSSTSAYARCTTNPAQQCQKFNLYYYSEVNSAVQMVTSKNQ